MVKRKRKRKHRSKSKRTNIPKGVASSESAKISLLDVLAEKRTGGAEGTKGFVFQWKYAVWKMLTYLTPNGRSERKSITLEGVEDLDISNVSVQDERFTEFIQVKFSGNRMDAGTFWEKGILQNFAEDYLENSKSHFRFVHNMPFAKGYLSRLADTSRKQIELIPSDFEYWKKKFDEFSQQNGKREWNWSSFDLTDFLGRITFERVSESFLVKEASSILIRDQGITSGNEDQYLRALYWSAILWSRDSKTIYYTDLNKSIETVKEDIAKGPINPAVQGKWLVNVSFEALKEKDAMSYFEGKAARPFHIAAGLPARRNKWEKEILQFFHKYDVTVIPASSGQGKSTLAWQVTFDLVSKGWSAYELLWCRDGKEIGNIITFIESRIRIGELPLIIIDGLREAVSGWAELARRTLQLPVKYIVTTGEEDWYRFGADRSQLRLIPVNIQMTREEAGHIFKQFQKAGKIHSNTTSWQSAWERVEDRGLLMEYVYLLTQGEMLEERLSHQIQLLANEKNGAAKLEILRLVSVADLCSIRLPTSALVASIQDRIGFQGDRGECLKSLQREYYIQLEDRTYVEGFIQFVLNILLIFCMIPFLLLIHWLMYYPLSKLIVYTTTLLMHH